MLFVWSIWAFLIRMVWYEVFWHGWIWRFIHYQSCFLFHCLILKALTIEKAGSRENKLLTLLHSFWRIIYRRHFRECHSCCVCSGAACAGNCRPNLEKREYTQLSLAVVGQPRLSLVENCIYNWIKTTLPHLRKTRRRAREGGEREGHVSCTLITMV